MQIGKPVNVAILGIFGFFVFVALHLAQNVFAPLVTALVFGVVLSPLANAARAHRFSNLAVAVFVLVGGLTLLGLLVLVLWSPVQALVEQAPVIWSRVQSVLVDLKRSVRDLASFGERLKTLTGGDGTVVTADDSTNVATSALNFAPTLVAQITIFAGALFFFVLSRRDIYHSLARCGAGHGGRRFLPENIATTERRVSRYFITLSIINAVLGLATFLAMTAIGLPSPALWGVVAAGLNFVPYLGPATVTVMLGVAGDVSFSGPFTIVPAAAYVALNFVEGQFVTPAVLGRTLTVNPLLVFMSLIFWIWLWGPIGGVVAIPLMLTATSFVEQQTPRAPRPPKPWVHPIAGATRRPLPKPARRPAPKPADTGGPRG